MLDHILLKTELHLLCVQQNCASVFLIIQNLLCSIYIFFKSDLKFEYTALLMLILDASGYQNAKCSLVFAPFLIFLVDFSFSKCWQNAESFVV